MMEIFPRRRCVLISFIALGRSGSKYIPLFSFIVSFTYLTLSWEMFFACVSALFFSFVCFVFIYEVVKERVFL